jgi:diaminopimelate epimerase
MTARKTLRFTKMQGAGNDYVYVNCFEETVKDPAALAPIVSDRHFGIGSDGLVLILPSETADVQMRMFNPDCSEAEMCGNAIRCVAKYAYDHGLCRSTEMRIETQAGIKPVTLNIHDGDVRGVRVDMGVPDMRRGVIPMVGPVNELALNVPIAAKGMEFTATCVSMGNPHCVIFTPDVAAVPLEVLGPAIETLPLFPKRINVHFVQVLNRVEIRVRTWERGTGITLACGSGASACCVAAAHTGRADRTVTGHLPGGDLLLEWAESGHVFMTGPAVEVFQGEWPL